jgi:hypothetical protein
VEICSESGTVIEDKYPWCGNSAQQVYQKQQNAIPPRRPYSTMPTHRVTKVTQSTRLDVILPEKVYKNYAPHNINETETQKLQEGYTPRREYTETPKLQKGYTPNLKDTIRQNNQAKNTKRYSPPDLTRLLACQLRRSGD